VTFILAQCQSACGRLGELAKAAAEGAKRTNTLTQMGSSLPFTIRRQALRPGGLHTWAGWCPARRRHACYETRRSTPGFPPLPTLRAPKLTAAAHLAVSYSWLQVLLPMLPDPQQQASRAASGGRWCFSRGRWRSTAGFAPPPVAGLPHNARPMQKRPPVHLERSSRTRRCEP